MERKTQNKPSTSSAPPHSKRERPQPSTGAIAPTVTNPTTTPAVPLNPIPNLSMEQVLRMLTMTPKGRAAHAAVAQQPEPAQQPQQPLQILPQPESEPLQSERNVTEAEGGLIEALEDLEEEVDYGDDFVSLEEAEVGDEAEVVGTGRNITREEVEEEGNVSSEEEIGLEKEVVVKETEVNQGVVESVVAEEVVEKTSEGLECLSLKRKWTNRKLEREK